MSTLFGDMGQMFKQARQMQAHMKEIQEALAKKTIETSSGGGMVTVTMNGKQEIVSLVIDPTVLREDPQMIQDLVAAAVNQALRESPKLIQGEMSKLTGGLRVPGLF